MSTINKLTAIFREVFDDETIEIEPETTANEIEGWDSLSHINLILAVELHFGIEFTQKEIRSFSNVGDFVKCIDEKSGI